MNTADMLFFDTLAYAKKLKNAGFTEEQAEVQSEALAGVLENNMATKRDIADLEQATKRNFEVFQQASKRDILSIEQQILGVKQQGLDIKQSLEQQIETLGYKLTIRLGGMLVVTVGVISALQLLT